jgi:Protein of unknown function (DUF3073)
LRSGGGALRRSSEAEIIGAYWLRTFEGVEPMGRGRAKAKQVKVARQLKYKSSDGSDLDRIRRELAVGTESSNGDLDSAAEDFDDEEDDDEEGDSEEAWRLKPAT